MSKSKTVELPPGCIVTDRRTWERQRSEVVRLEADNRQLAERLQHLTSSNEALRQQLGEAEELATEALTNAERARHLLDATRPVVESCDRALSKARTGLNAAAIAFKGAGALGGKITAGKQAVSSSAPKVRRWLSEVDK